MNWGARAHEVLFRLSAAKEYSGVAVRMFWPEPHERTSALPKLAKALDLLAVYDSRRFDRLRRLCRGILVFGDIGPSGKWVPRAHLICLSSSYVCAPATTSARVAATLVHESTHAWLDSFGFDYREDRRARIEHICIRAEMAFARRLPDPEDLLELSNRKLSLEPEFWSNAQFAARAKEDLLKLGLPRFLTSAIIRLRPKDAA
jgi:hypothetical protein